MLNLDVESIQILSKSFSIEREDMSEEKWGETHHMNQTIKINSGLNEDCQETTLLHEIIHSIDVCMQLGLKENQIVTLAEVLLDVLKRNENLIIK